MRFVPLSEIEAPALRFVPLSEIEKPAAPVEAPPGPTEAPPLPAAGTMTGIEEAVAAPPPAPVEAAAPPARTEEPILPEEASISSFVRGRPTEARAYTPTLMQRLAEMLPGNKARALNEYIARQIAKERGVSVEQVYRDIGGAQPMFNPEGRAPLTAAAEAAGVIAEEIPKVPGAVASTALRAYRAGEFDVVDKTWVDRAITAMKPERDGKADPNYAAFQGLGESLGFSVANMVASITSGAAATSLTGGNPLAGVAAGMATSGTIAYRASKDDFLERVKDKLDKQSKALYGKPLSSEDWKAASEEFNRAAVEYGLWEAIPEAVSNAIFLKAFAGPAKGLSASRLADLAPKAGALAAEQATETITGLGQNAAERKAKLTEEELSVVDAFRQQFLQTLLISGVMGGGLKGKQLADQFYREQVQPRIDPASALGRAIQADIDAVGFNPAAIQAEAIEAMQGRAPRTLEELARTQLPIAPPAPEAPPEEEAEPIFKGAPAPAERVEPTLGEEPIVVEGRAEPSLGPIETTAPPVKPAPVAAAPVVAPAIEAPTEEPVVEPVEAKAPPAAPPIQPVTAVPGMPTGEELEEPEPVVEVKPLNVKPTQAAAALPEEPTVAPVTTPKVFEPTPVNLELDGLPTVEVPLTQLRLSKDVPQFKLGATEEGIVEPLGGKFERVGVAPVQVWRRTDGSLEVISGRHRFDLAKRSGEKTIPAQIHDESQGFDANKAAILDAELNIRDGQGKVKDYVSYFKATNLSKEDAESRGLLARATGKRSYTIANQGGDELIAAVRADQIGDEAAFYIALNAPNDARLQSVGIKAIQDGKSLNTATNMMQAVKALAGETDTTLDMFGFDDSAIREAEEMAKLASRKQKEIADRLSAIKGAAKRPEVARAEGIDIKDVDAINRRIADLEGQKAAWNNWSTNPALVAEIRAARGVEPPAPTVVEPPAAPAEPSLFEEDLLTAPTPEDIKAREEAAAKRAQEAAEAERKAKADEARGDFVLTGSERAADEAAARGQMELGEAPTEPEAVSERKLSPANIEPSVTDRAERMAVPLENIPPKQTDVTERAAAPDPSLLTREGDLIVGREAVREYQIKEYAVLRKKLAGVAVTVAKGEVDIDVQRNTTDMMRKSRELQAAIKATKPRIDTPEAFLAKALQEYDKGNIEKDVLDVIQAAYNKQPELLNGLLLSVRKEEGAAAGRFDPFRRVVFLFKQTSGVYNPATIRHELAHSLEQMMTPDQRVAVVQAWGKALARAIKQNPDQLHQNYFNAVLDFLENPSARSFRKAQSLLPSYEMYQFINPSEYWAVNAEKLMAAQLGTAWERFKKAVRQLFEGLKKVLGFDNRYDVHKVFSQVMGGSKARITRETLVDLILDTDGSAFVTLNNINDADKILKKYSRPNTPQLDTTPVRTFLTRQFKNGKEFFADAAENPKEAMTGAGNAVMDGLIYLRNKNVWYGSGLESRDFERYNGDLRTSEGLVTGSVALDNAIRSGNIGVEVIFRGGIEYKEKMGNFVAVETDKGMRGVYEAEAKLKDRLGDQRGTDIIQGYLEAKRSISIMDEFLNRTAAYEAAKDNYNTLKAMGTDPDATAQAKEAMDAAAKDVDAINKARSSVNMSEEEMYEFAALDEQYPELRDIMDNWTAINQNLLRMWRQVGLLSQGRYETLAAIKDYVPWYRIMDDEADVHDPIQSTTRAMTNIGREKLFKRGKPKSVVDFRATAGQKDFKIQPSSVVNVLVNGKKVNPDLVSVTPQGDVRLDMDLEENDLVVFETSREIQNIIDNMTRNVMRMTMNGIRQFAANRIVLEYASRNEKGKIMVFPSVDKDKGRFNWIVNGKKVVVEIQDPLVASSIYGMENLNLKMWAPLAAVANLTRRTITLSGVFQVKQVFKDAPTAALVTGVKNPLALIGGVYKGFLTSLTNTDPVVDILKAAGIGGYMSPARTPEAEIKRRLGIMNRNVFSFVIKGLDHIGDSSDMAQRVATYKRVLAETGDEAQALYQAANVINFLHHGSAGYAQAIVKVVPFMGAYANATDVLVRSLFGSGLKGVSRKKALARLGMTTALLTSMTLLYCMLAGADPEYDEIDDQTKLRNVMIPGTDIMLPMNTSAAFFFKAIPELIYNQVTREGTENAMDARRLRRALGEAAKDMLLGPEPIPAGVKPILEVAIDRNFYTGRTVIPEGLKDVAAAEQYTASTSELGKQLSAMLQIPGTDKRVISPIEADHLVRGIFGTAGAMAQWVTNSIGVIAETRPEPTQRETPIVGSFLRPEVPRGREDLFYDFKKDVTEKYKTYKRMLDQEDFDAADAYLEKNGDVAAMFKYISKTDEKLQKINAEIRRVGETKAKDMTPKERREEITDLQKIKRDALDAVIELRQETYGLGFLGAK